MTEEGGGGADPPAQAGLTGRPPRPIPEPKPKSVHGPAKVIAWACGAGLLVSIAVTGIARDVVRRGGRGE